MATGSSATAMAVLTSTASRPSPAPAPHGSGRRSRRRPPPGPSPARNNLQHGFGFQPLFGSRSAHPAASPRAAHLFLSFTQHRIGAAVGQHHEPFAAQQLRRFQGFNRVGQQPAGVRGDPQLQPMGTQGSAPAGGKHRLFPRLGA